MKKALKVILIVMICFVVIMGGMIVFISIGVKDGDKIQIGSVDLSTVADGSYTGSYKNGRWSNTVVVEVKNHAIVSVAVTKDVMFSKEDTKNQIISEVIQNQNCNVDAISGATITSKAYLKAIENALSKD
jgi:uncharacterized protein with FMN-binding domain